MNLHCKHETLSLNPSPTKKKPQKNQKPKTNPSRLQIFVKQIE
jgi:hypothetical protein